MATIEIEARGKTNIIFILTDDQGVWAAGCYGNPDKDGITLDVGAGQNRPVGVRWEDGTDAFAYTAFKKARQK